MKETAHTENGWILVTGHSGGIGQAIIRKLLQARYSVYGVSRSNVSLNQEASNGSSLLEASVDLNNTDILGDLVVGISNQIGPLRGFVHCAGEDLLKPLYLTKSTDYFDLFRTHVVVPLLILSKLSSSAKYIQQDFSAVLISSLATHEGAKGHVAYAAAKGALEGALKACCAELLPRKARVNIIVPGVVSTPMSEKWIARLGTESRLALQNSYPLGFGSPDDIANATNFLLSADSRWITGQKFIMDGGHLIQSV